MKKSDAISPENRNICQGNYSPPNIFFYGFLASGKMCFFFQSLNIIQALLNGIHKNLSGEKVY